MLKLLAKFGDAVYLRAHLQLELQRAARSGVHVPDWLVARAWKRPNSAEDLIDFLRFLNPTDKIRLIDIGANCGDWAADFVSLFPDTEVVAVEPVPATFAKLTARFAGDRRFTVVNAAISDAEGQATMHVGADDTLASFHAYAAPFRGMRGQKNRLRHETVETMRLDGLPVRWNERRTTVLKIDVQGHETAALATGAGLLHQVDLAIVELCFVEEYESVPPSFYPCTRLLGEAGLFPAIFQEYGRWRLRYAAERDVIYCRLDRLPRLID